MAPPAETYLAIPPGDHCLSGNLHTGDTRGKTETIEEAPTYITTPQHGNDNGNILFYYPDVHGFYNNSLLLMDAFADAGYHVFGIDYFRDDPIWKHQNADKSVKPDFDRAAWRDKHVAFAKATVPKWTKAIADKYGKDTTKYVCAGYCFGATYVLDSLTKGFISAGAFAHPGSLTEEQFQNVDKPLLLSCAEKDHAFPPGKRNKAQAILEEGQKKYQVQLFQGVSHGFAVRCNLEDPYERYVKEQSYRGIVEWFNFWLSQ
ncbi:alpha/beta-hydrolase [Microthyrium microscopicum]|uniref:Alpha/beta-hydrolase n=1 Tax=Microthyrium microscopicum TaxID=703497 RepID=A0A6A6U1Q5_9PEZI|nr:alpha/beta-hydrolase [Microthyrium microscopicum]